MHAKIFNLTAKRIYVAGHRGMVGSAILRRLATCGCDMITAGRDEVDLERQDQAEGFLTKSRPDVVIVAAAKVGGIRANSVYPAEFKLAVTGDHRRLHGPTHVLAQRCAMAFVSCKNAAPFTSRRLNCASPRIPGREDEHSRSGTSCSTPLAHQDDLGCEQSGTAGGPEEGI